MASSLHGDTITIYSRSAPADEIPEYQLCTVYQCNNIIDIISIKKRSRTLSHYRRVSKSYYCNDETGEVFEYRKQTGRFESLKETFAQLRRLINNNFIGSHSESMLVLTYASFMDNPGQLYQDFRRFWLRFKYHYPLTEYIAIVEPQASGSYHIHALVKTTNGSRLFVPKKQLDKLWTFGGTYISRITDVDNLGAYFCSYFTNVDYFEGTYLQEKYPSGKLIVKNSRLPLYPQNFKIYRCSKGISRPKPVTMPFGEIKNIVGNAKPVQMFSKEIISVNDSHEESILNKIEYRQYNLKRIRNNREEIYL